MDTIGLVVEHLYTHQISKTREAFLIKVKEEPSDSVYKEDVVKTMTDDLWVERFLEWHHGSVSRAVEGLLFSLRYQKRFKVRELKNTHFPSEFFSIMFFYKNDDGQYITDRNGRAVLYMRVTKNPRFKETRDMTLQFAAYLHFQAEELFLKSGGKGFILINDCNGISFSNFDFKLLYALMDFKDVFPIASALLITVNLPRALKIVYDAVKYAVPADQHKGVLLLDQKELQNIIKPANIPSFLGGLSQLNTVAPKGCHYFRQILMDQDNLGAKIDTNVVCLPQNLNHITKQNICEAYENNSWNYHLQTVS